MTLVSHLIKALRGSSFDIFSTGEPKHGVPAVCTPTREWGGQCYLLKRSWSYPEDAGNTEDYFLTSPVLSTQSLTAQVKLVVLKWSGGQWPHPCMGHQLPLWQAPVREATGLCLMLWSEAQHPPGDSLTFPLYLCTDFTYAIAGCLSEGNWMRTWRSSWTVLTAVSSVVIDFTKNPWSDTWTARNLTLRVRTYKYVCLLK